MGKEKAWGRAMLYFCNETTCRNIATYELVTKHSIVGQYCGRHIDEAADEYNKESISGEVQDV